MRPVTKRWARLGKWNPKMLAHTHDAGVCLSAFIVAKRGNSVLVCRPRGSNAWPEKGGYPKHLAAKLEQEGAWLLPATHLLIEESPNHAAQRITSQWAGLKGQPRFVMVQSHTRRGSLWNRRAKRKHWDICFVYELAVHRIPSRKPWWSEIRFVPLSQMRSIKMGRGHKDVLSEAGYV